MNILYLSSLDGRPWSGPTYSVPNQVEAQAKIDRVLWYNLKDRTHSQWRETMDQWHEKEYYRDLADCPQKSLRALPEPFSHPDLIIIEQCYKFMLLPIRLEIERSGIPYIIVPRVELTAKAQKQKKLKKKAANLLIINRFLKHAAAIHYLTEEEARESGSGWNESYFVLPNGTESCDAVKPAEPHQGIRCIFIGRLAPYHKGLDVLIEACGNIRKEMTEAGCVIDVYGPDREGKKAEMQETVREKQIEGILRFHDGIYGEEKKNRMLQSDIFLMTSRFEGHPTALLDALAMGLPVMVTRGTNMLEEVQRADAGWTAEGDAASIQEMFLQMIREKETLKEKSENARKLSERYNWNAIAERGHQLYLQLLKSKTPSAAETQQTGK